MDTTQSKLDLNKKHTKKMQNLINMLINQLKVTLKKLTQHLSASFVILRNVDVDAYEVGQEVSVDTFVAGDVIDVTGVSKGKGFQGAIKSHGQSRGPMSHGSHFHRAPGSGRYGFRCF